MKLLGKKLVGLTGGIGSGKSTVAAILQGFGATIVDADAISRATTAVGGSAIAPIRQTFGQNFIDASGELDRTKMRELVFSDTNAKQRLEAIVHPLVKLEMQHQIEAATSALVVLDLPLLAEATGFAGWKPLLDAVCVVDCSPETQIKRVMTRSVQAGHPTTESAVRAIMGNQASRLARLAIADVVITNDVIGLDALKLSVHDLWLKLQ